MSVPIAFPEPRLLPKDGICTYLGGISSTTYDNWQAKGIVPGPVPGTNRYDIKAHGAALDRCAGLNDAAARPPMSPLDEWESGYARQA